MYVLQIDVEACRSKNLCGSWPGYYSGIGFVDKPENALLFITKQQAAMAAFGTHIGLNGGLKIIQV